jgi:outer membrane lipopolysaccharide assembly protein LptE/RlpB
MRSTAYPLRACLCAILLAALAGCGYHIAGKTGKMPGGITSVTIPVFTNNTNKPDIEAALTNAFTNEFLTTVKVADSAPHVMEGVITSYDLRSVSFTKSDVTQEYRLTVVLSLKLHAKDDETVLWEDPKVSDYEDFFVNTLDVNATKEAEFEALKKLAKDTARTIKERMLEDF